MARAHSNGIEIEYEVLGPASAPPVLMIMGLGAQLVRWPQGFCDALVAGGYRLIRYDNRDVGLSTQMSGRASIVGGLVRRSLGLAARAPYSLDDMASDARGLLDALAIPRAHVVGVSMGGMIGQLLTARHPDRVRSFVSIMSTSGDLRLPGPRADLRRLLLARAPAGGRAGRIARIYRVMSRIGSPGYPPDAADLFSRVSREVERSDRPAGFLRHLAAIVSSPSRLDLLSHIRTPTLILHGQEDPLVPVAAAHDLHARIAGSRLQIFVGMGHDLPAALTPQICGHILSHLRAADGFQVG